MHEGNRELAPEFSSPAEELAWFGRLISHEIRVRILAALYTHAASATQIADEIGEPMTTVAYHVRLLADGGTLDLVSEQRIRGGLERTYKLSDQTLARLEQLRRLAAQLSARSG